MKTIKVGKYAYLKDMDRGVYPVFSREIRRRVRNKKAVNIAVVGEAGEGKSYIGIQIARMIHPNFKVKQVIFGLKEYLLLTLRLGMGKPIVFDEPSYAMGKRDWYKEINKVLVLSIESSRFKVHPLIIPVINLNLLDKSIRSYLIQYLVHVLDRGKAIVYRIRAAQHKDGFYRYHMCNIHYGMMDNNKCKKDSCLGCRKIMGCKLMRAQYERKKALTQDARYESSLVEAEKKELSSKDFTTKQFMGLIDRYHSEMCNENGELEAVRIRTVLLVKEQVRIGKDKANFLRQHYLYTRSLNSSER